MVCQFWKISDQAIEIVDLRIQVVVPAKNQTKKKTIKIRKTYILEILFSS